MNEFWMEWKDALIPWLLTHGLRMGIVVAGAFILNKLAHRFMVKIGWSPVNCVSESSWQLMKPA